AADYFAGAILGVVGGITKELDSSAKIGFGDEIQLIRAQGLVGIRQPINPIILEIKVTGGGMECEARRIAQARGDLGKIRRRHVGALLLNREHVKGVPIQSSGRTGNVAVRELDSLGSRAKVAVRT